MTLNLTNYSKYLPSMWRWKWSFVKIILFSITKYLFKFSDNIVRQRYFQCSVSNKNVRELWRGCCEEYQELNAARSYSPLLSRLPSDIDNNFSHSGAMETETMFPTISPKSESNINKPQQNSPDFNQNNSGQSKLSRQNILIYNR